MGRAEAADPALASRAHIADMALLHRLAPYDPCVPCEDDRAGIEALISVIDTDGHAPSGQ